MKVSESTLISAFRYSLGRHTYIVSDMVADIIRNWENISKKTKDLFIREILEYRQHWKSIEHDCDDKEWQKIIDINKKK